MIIKTEITIRVPVDIDRLRSWLSAHDYRHVPAAHPTERWIHAPDGDETWASSDCALHLPSAVHTPGEAAEIVSRAIHNLAHHHRLTQHEMTDQIAATELPS